MCGVLGIYSNQDVFKDLYQGLLAIQHRGQDAAGMITYDGRFHTKKGNGLVNDIFDAAHAKRLCGPIGIGHTRYPTMGGGRGEDAQPFFVNSPFGIIMAHNGNVVNYAELKEQLFLEHRRILNSDNDVEAVLNVFAQELAAQEALDLTPEHIYTAVKGVYDKVKGSYSVVAYIAEQGMVAFRDPYGIKPLVYGKRKDGMLPSYAVASESVSLNIMNFSDLKDIKPGQVLFIDKHRKLHTRRLVQHAHSPCLFEWVYFARPDSFIDDVNVYNCRIRLGRLLAQDIKKLDLKIDVVVPVPDSARDAAIEIARTLNLRYREALVKNRYIGIPSPRNSGTRTSCSWTTASCAATPPAPSSRWFGNAGPKRSTSDPIHRPCASPVYTASTCRPTRNLWPPTPRQKRSPERSGPTGSFTNPWIR